MMHYQVKHKTGWVGEVIEIEDGCVTVKRGNEKIDYAFPEVFQVEEDGAIFEVLDEEFNGIIAEKTREQEERALKRAKEKEEREALKKKKQEEIARKREEEARKKAEARKEAEAARASVLTGKFTFRPVPMGPHKKAKKIKRTEGFTPTEEQAAALAVLESGENVFLSGEAGTGKSFVVNEFLDRNEGKNIIVCAPTGIAAINVGGTTLHRMFKIPMQGAEPGEYNHGPSDAIIKADIIVIDEISMLRMDNFEYVIRTIREAERLLAEERSKATGTPAEIRRKQVVVVGDFFQLPPVIASKDRELLDLRWGEGVMGSGFAFRSKLWQEMHFHPVILKQVMRQEEGSEFTENLNLIRHGNQAGVDWFNENAKEEALDGAIYLCGRNAEVNRINEERTAKLPGKEKIYCASMSGEVKDSDKATADALVLKEGMQVMTLVNQPEGLYQNGSIGVIESLMNDFVTVRFADGRVVPVSPFNWDIFGYEVQKDQGQKEKVEKVVLGTFKQLPLKVAYAITIHKSQGQTYDKANISPDCFDAGQLYVALSRVKSVEGLSLTHKIPWYALKTSSEVGAFYGEMEKNDGI